MSPNESVTPDSHEVSGLERNHCQTPTDLDPGAPAPVDGDPSSAATESVADEQQPTCEDDLPRLAQAHLLGRRQPRRRGKRLVLPADQPDPVSPQQRLLL